MSENDDPDFSVSFIRKDEDGEDAVKAVYFTLLDPQDDVPASQALLYGLAIAMLDQNGAIDEMIDELTKDGIPSQKECIASIDLLLSDTHERTH